MSAAQFRQVIDVDLNAPFILNVGSKDAILEISYIGYQGQSLKVTPGKTLSVVLKEDTQSLDEVVVVGFGVQKKANLTGAVSQVKMDDVLGSRPVVNAMSALQGAMPGLHTGPACRDPCRRWSFSARRPHGRA